MVELEKPSFFPSLIKQYLQNEKFSGMYYGPYFNQSLIILKHMHTFIMVFDLRTDNLVFTDKVYCDKKIPRNKVEIVGKENFILLLDSEGSLYQLVNTNKDVLSQFISRAQEWVLFKKFNFKKVFAISEYYGYFACLGAENDGVKKIKCFKKENGELIAVFQDYRLEELNLTQSNDYYLKFYNYNMVIVSDKISGKTHLVNLTDNKKCELLCSNAPMVSAVTHNLGILFFFENGKVVLYNENLSTVFYMRKKIKCIVQCKGSGICFLWSDGVNLHHTDINTEEKKITHFKVEPNVTGVVALANTYENKFIAITVNNAYYYVKFDHQQSKKIVQAPGEILSEIYNESLRLNDIQENLRTASKYLRFKEMIQENLTQLELKQSENFLIIRNLTEVTFEKEFWKIKCKTSLKGLEQVKVVDLEADLVKGMMLQIQNPFVIDQKVKVYLFGAFPWGILRFFIGDVGCRDDLGKENLKKRLHEIKLKKNSSMVKK